MKTKTELLINQEWHNDSVATLDVAGEPVVFLEITNGRTNSLGYARDFNTAAFVMDDGTGENDEAWQVAQLISQAPAMLKVLKGLRGIEAFITDRQMKEHFQATVYPVIEATELPRPILK